MFKNVASQHIEFFAFDTTTGAAKTGDAANITAYVAIDGGSVTVLTDTSATEKSSSNAKGWYQFDVAQAESNGDDLLFTAQSTTANVSVVGRPIQTLPAAMANVAGAAGGLFIAGTNAATTITTALTTTFTGNLTGSVGSISGVTFPANFASFVIDSTGRVNAFLIGVLTSVFTEGATGRIAAAFKQFFNIASPASTMDHGVLVDTVTTTTTTTTATNLTNAPTAGDFTATMKTSIGTAVAASAVASVTGAVGSVTGNVGGNVTGSVGSVVGAVGSVTGAVGSVTGAVGSVTGNVGGNVTGSVGSVVGLTASNLDATVTSRAAAATALTNATWTDARAAFLDNLNALKIKKNTALANFPFLMVLSSDHITPGTGLSVTAQRSIDGGAFGACTNSPSEISAGVYKISLSAADLNGDTITLKLTAATADQRTIVIATEP